jgi:hypothetical protein
MRIPRLVTARNQGVLGRREFFPPPRPIETNFPVSEAARRSAADTAPTRSGKICKQITSLDLSGNRLLLQFGQELLETGVVAEEVVVGIVFDPVAFAPAAGEDAFEKFESSFFLAGFGMQASRVDQSADVVGMQCKRTFRPLNGPLFLAVFVKRAGAERQRSNVARI